MTARLGIRASSHVVPAAGGDAYHTAVLASSPVGFWPLDETTGAAVELVAGRNGTRQGSPLTATVFGRTALRPNGGYVEVADAAAFSPHAGATGKMTLEAIVQRGTGDGSWCSKATGGAYEFNARLGGTQVVMFMWNASGTDAANVATTNPELVVGNDYHVAVTYDRASLAACVIYKNGVAVPTSPTFQGTTYTADTTSPVNFGRRGDGADGFAGVVGCVAIYNRVLTAGEVAAHYAAL